MLQVTILTQESADSILEQIHNSAKEFVEDAADVAYRSFQRHAPVGLTGRTHEAIFKTRATISETGGYEASAGVSEVEGASDPRYPLYVHEGTGIFGPSKAPIFATHGNVMVFEKEGEGAVFTRWVQGQEAQPYLQDVADDVQRWIRVHKHDIVRTINNA